MLEINDVLELDKYIGDVDAVVFDLDDTLYSEKDYVRSGYHMIAEQFGFPALEEQMWKIFLRGGKAIDEALASKGLLLRKDEALRIYREQKPNIKLYPGVAEMLKQIRKTKKTGIITDGRPTGQRNKIAALGLNSIIDEIIVTDELGGVGFRKPHEAAFRLMQIRLQTPFEKMLYIGDNPVKDFIAPEKLGMKWVYFKNSNGLYSKSKVTY